MKTPHIKKSNKIRNIEVLEMYHGLKNLKGIEGIKLVYAINRTVAWLKPIAEAFSQEELIPIPDGYKKYQAELREFYEKMVTNEDGSKRTRVVQGPDGKPMEQLDVSFSDPKVIAGKAKIDKKHEKAIADYQKDIEEYNQFLNKECEEEIRLFMIPLAYAPDKKEQYDVIAPLVKDMTAEQQARWEELFTEIRTE